MGADFLRNTKLNDGSILGNNPNVVRAFADLAEKLSEDTIVQGDTPSTMTIKEIDREIEELTSEGSPYWNKSHINHKKAVQEVQSLYELKERSKMANEKFEAQGEITDTEIRLECLRLATEFGPENERRDPLPIAEIIITGLKKILSDNLKRPLRKTLIDEYKFKDEILNRKIKSINHQNIIGGT